MLRAFAVGLALCASMFLQAQAEQTITFVERPDTAQTNPYYVSNRAPLEASPWVKLPPGAVKAKGWLHHQLELAADGMVGRLPEISPWLKMEGNGWANPKADGGWEELPY